MVTDDFFSFFVKKIILRKIEAAEMLFLRPMAGYRLRNKKRSSDIREQLIISVINDKLTQYKINWRNIYKKGWQQTTQKKIKLQT